MGQEIWAELAGQKDLIIEDPISGRLVDATSSIFADKLIELRNTKGPWEVIDEIVSFWIKRNPKYWDSFVVHVDHKKSTRATSYGSNKAKTLRSVVDVPQQVLGMIRAMYASDELPFDKDFFMKFAQRYPRFRVAERL